MGVKWDIAINQLSIIDLLYLRLSRSPVPLVSLRRLKIVDRGFKIRWSSLHRMHMHIFFIQFPMQSLFFSKVPPIAVQVGGTALMCSLGSNSFALQ